jgi:hypothetical protein
MSEIPGQSGHALPNLKRRFVPILLQKSVEGFREQ